VLNSVPIERDNVATAQNEGSERRDSEIRWNALDVHAVTRLSKRVLQA
jgi:hypothetical protein